jgi:hypothetical protein
VIHYSQLNELARRRLLNGLGLVIVIPLMVACASGHTFRPETQQGEKESLLYVFRPAKFLSGGETPDIFINDKKSLTLVNGGYSVFHITSGRYRIEIKKPTGLLSFMVSDFSSMVEFRAEPSHSYFIRWSPELLDSQYLYAPIGSGAVFASYKRAGNMALLSEEVAIPEISKCDYLAPEVSDVVPAAE